MRIHRAAPASPSRRARRAAEARARARVAVVYKPVDQSGDATLPDAMNWEGKMTIPKSWYDSPVSRLTEYAVTTRVARRFRAYARDGRTRVASPGTTSGTPS